MGGALTAMSPDFKQSVLNVTGMNYSNLLRRSVDSDEYFKAAGIGLYDWYPNELERPLLLSMMQLLWDRGEANGYAHHLTDDPLPNTPSHEVLLQVATGDHQVSNVTAEIKARTAGVPVYSPLAPGRHWESNPFAELTPINFGAGPAFTPHTGSALVYYDGGPVTYSNVGGDAPGPARVPECTGEPVPGLGRDADGRNRSARGGRLRRGPARLPAQSGRRPPAHQGLPEAERHRIHPPVHDGCRDPALLLERLGRDPVTPAIGGYAATLPRL